MKICHCMTWLGWGPLECIRISATDPTISRTERDSHTWTDAPVTRPALLSGSTRAAIPYFFEVLRGWRVMNVRNSASTALGLRFDAFGVHDFRLVLGRHSSRERPRRDPRLPQRRLPSQVPLRSYTADTGTDELPGTDLTFAFATS